MTCRKGLQNIALTYYNSLLFAEKGRENPVYTLEILLEFMGRKSELGIFFHFAASKTSRAPVYRNICLPFLC